MKRLTPSFLPHQITWAKLVIILLVGGLAMSLYIGHYLTSAQTGVTTDDARYLVVAESFFSGLPFRVISYPHAPVETVWPPGYPLFVLAPAGLLLGHKNYELLRFTSVLIAVGSLAPLYLLLRERDHKAHLAIVATVLFALNPMVAGLAGMAMSEATFICLILISILLVVNLAKRKKARNTWWRPAVAGMVIGAAVLVRYQGVALVAAALIYLVHNRKRKEAAILAGFTAFTVIPYVTFLATSIGSSGGSVFAVQMIEGQLGTLIERLPGAVVRHGSAVGLTVLPILGPRAGALLGKLGLSTLIPIAHMSIFLTLAISVTLRLLRRDLVALFCALYFALVLLIDNHGGAYNNEVRYSVILMPFAYYLLLDLAGKALGRTGLLSEEVTGRALRVVITIVLLALVLRNIQQMMTPFVVPDLSAGSEWLKSHTSPESVVATHDPVERYLYIQRKTVDLDEELVQAVVDEIDKPAVDFILVGPPLRIDQRANTEVTYSEADNEVLLPLINDQPDIFNLVWKDKSQNVLVYETVDAESEVNTETD